MGMDAAAKSLAVFGVYLLLNAAGLLIVPDMVLGSFGLPGTAEPWIRVVGLLAGVIGYYYLVVAVKGLRSFYPVTVHGRCAGAVVFFAMVATKAGPWQLLIFGAVDLLAAAWTHLALRRREA